MKKQLFIIPIFMAVAGFANAATYKITIAQSVMVEGKELKAGDYKVEVNDTIAVIRNGKDSTEVKVKTESTDRKYDSTSVRCSQDGAKYTLQEIHVGGTKTKLVFDTPKSANGGI